MRETCVFVRFTPIFKPFYISKMIKKDDLHNYKEVPVIESIKDTFDKQWICTICNCRKLRAREDHLYFSFSREKVYHPVEPKCFGSIPINQQTIDR